MTSRMHHGAVLLCDVYMCVRVCSVTLPISHVRSLGSCRLSLYGGIVINSETHLEYCRSISTLRTDGARAEGKTRVLPFGRATIHIAIGPRRLLR